MLTGVIFDWAQKTPDKAALVYNQRAVSYRAFADLIALARGYFIAHGVTGPGVAVVATVNLADFWVLSLALRSLGLTTITRGSAERIAEIGLPDIRCVATSPREAWPGLDEVSARLGVSLHRVDLTGARAVDLGAGSDQPIAGHILETSGTTGVFKKVLMDPAFEEAFLRLRCANNGHGHDAVANVFDFPAGTGVGYKTPAAIWLVGGTVVIRQIDFRHGGDLYEVLRYPGLTYAAVVPPVLNALLAAPEGAYPRNENLMLAITGGTVTQRQIDQAKARITSHLVNSFSATESHLVGLTRLDTPDDHRWHQRAPTTRIEIVDEFDQPTPLGQVGRLRIDTTNGPNGYLGDEAATRTFFKDGFFYPGDLAMMREDGRIALQGRVTDVINVSGRKVSPAPIEDVLRQAFGVTGVCLFSMQDEHGDEEAHLIIETPTPIAPDRIAAVLRQTLEGFPRARVHYMRQLPRNGMGKVMRNDARAAALGKPGPRP